MKREDSRAQLFTLDLMLALIPLTIVLGMSATALSGLSSQVQTYIYHYDMKSYATEAADVLVKTPGDPPNWGENESPSTVGLAKADTGGRVFNNLDPEKVRTLNGSMLKKFLRDDVSYHRLRIKAVDGSFNETWGNESRSSVKDVFAVKRFAFMNGSAVEVILEVGR